MKKFTAYLLLIVILAMALSGCGNDSIDNETSLLPDVAPSASPMISPNTVPDNTPGTGMDTDDGMVKDRDGIIEERDNGSVNTPTVSPKASEKP